jgi:NAD(P)H-hydrate epimerase
MARGVARGADLEAAVARAGVVAIGPGLGTGNWGRGMLEAALAAGRPLVVDADALNLLAEAPSAPREDWILTPHPGEAARLLGASVGAVQADRLGAARSLQERFGGVVLLKGTGTVVDAGATPGICPFGNPGMASGGMGDLLTGILAALAAQDDLALDLPAAAELGVCLHGAAADRAALAGERGLLASDLLPPLRELLNP